MFSSDNSMVFRFIVLVALSIPMENSCYAQTAELRTISDFREAWDERFAAHASEIYEISGEAFSEKGRIYPPGRTLPGMAELPPGGFPEEDVRIPIRLKWIIDTTNNRFYKKIDTQNVLISELRFVPFVDIGCFDGETLLGWRPKDENRSADFELGETAPDLTYWRNTDIQHFVTNNHDLPIFFANGIAYLRTDELDKLKLSSWRELKVRGDASITGRKCAVLEANMKIAGGKSQKVSLFVDSDPSYSGAIRRYESRREDTLRTSLDVDWSSPAEGIPHPIKWVLSETLPDGLPLRVTTLVVDHYEVQDDIPVAVFQVAITPGMIVNKRAEGKSYRVQDDGKSLHEIDYESEKIAEYKPFSPYWVALGFFALLSILIGYKIVSSQ